MGQDSPTIPPPEPQNLSRSLTRNIDVLQERRARERAAADWQERIAHAITSFAGSMAFVYLHLAGYSAWVAAGLGLLPGVPRLDHSFTILSTAASVEAIFLSTFVLISQNLTAAAADRRAELDLHISLLTEHELTRLSRLVAEIADHLHVSRDEGHEIHEVMRDIAPEAVLDELHARQQED